MNNDKVKTLCNHLEQEITWVTALNALLVEEQSILETRQFQRLEEFANTKHDLSNKLESSAQQRMELINKTDQAADVALKEFLKECSPELINQVADLNRKLAIHLDQCRELNAVNGQVIANNLYIRQEIVNALSENSADAISVYNSHGNLQSTSDQKHHEQA